MAEHHGQSAILHGGIKRFLDGRIEAVDLVDEEDGSRLERGEECSDIGLALERRRGGVNEPRAQLSGDDVGERGLAKAGRPGEKHVVEWLAAAAGCLDEDLELTRHRLLGDEVGQAWRAKRAIEVLVAVEPCLSHRLLGPDAPHAHLGRGLDRGVGDDARAALGVHQAFLVSEASPARRRATEISCSGASPSAPSRRRSASISV